MKLGVILAVLGGVYLADVAIGALLAVIDAQSLSSIYVISLAVKSVICVALISYGWKRIKRSKLKVVER
jgi:hypothetical protein